MKKTEADKIIGAESSGAVALRGGDISLGMRDPDNPARRRVRCLNHPGGPLDRFVSIPGAGPLRWAEIEAAGWVKPCPSCATREKNPLPLTTGSTIYRGDRDETGKKARARCGICGYNEHFVSLSLGANQTGFCPACQPWAAVALQPEDYTGWSAERDKRYARINHVREMLRGEVGEVPRGLQPLMPFWALVKQFTERYSQTAPELSGASGTSKAKHLLLFFGDRPIGEFSVESDSEFTDSFLKGANRRGPRAPASARPPLELLRRMLRFAKEQGWIEENPLRRGVALGPAVSTYKDDRIMTVDEEGRLHAACAGKFAYLRTILIYVADGPAHLRDFLKLGWADVDFEKGLISGHKSLVKMTSRLSEAMQSLRDNSAHRPKGRVISRTVDQCNYDFDKVRAAAGVEGLKWTDIRRTGAWRMERAGKDTRQIAAALGMTHLDNVAELLRVNPVTAQQETDAPGFDQFVRTLFGRSGNGNGNEQKDKQTEVRTQQLLIVVKAIADLWSRVRGYNRPHEKLLALITQLDLAPSLGIHGQDDKTKRTQVATRLKTYGVASMFPGAESWFHSFRKTVVDEIEEGVAPELIVAKLRGRLSGTSAEGR